MNFLRWCKSIWSEPDGTGSSTRIHITLLIGFILLCGAILGALVLRRVITPEQFYGYLVPASTFISVTCAPLYAANKAADWAKSKNNNNSTDGQQ